MYELTDCKELFSPVILSEVAASRSEGGTESKDPYELLPRCSRKSADITAPRSANIAMPLSCCYGSFDSSSAFASECAASAQDDTC
jgi:hypothetical protein